MLECANEVNAKLKMIFINRFSINIDGFSSDMRNVELLDSGLGLAARDLLYLYFDIEREFGISIPQEDIAAGRFDTFSNIAEITANQLYKKQKDAV